MEEERIIQSVQSVLNNILLLGLCPPQTSEGMMNLLGKFASKEEILRVFKEGKIKWVMGMGEGMTYEDYNREMNKTAEKYMMS